MFNLNHPPNDIIIRKANNGYILILPEKIEQFNPVHVVSEFKAQFNKDEVLSKIESDNIQDEAISSIMNNENLYVFTKFSELLSFLSLKIDE